MNKPVVYKYKTAEEKIAALKDLVNYMAERVIKIEAENTRLHRTIINLSIKNKLLEIEVDEWVQLKNELDAELKRLNQINKGQRLRLKAEKEYK